MSTPSSASVNPLALDRLVLRVLSKILGCPCCGPEWWATLVIGFSERHGEQIGPELDAWHRKIHPACFKAQS